MAKRSGLFEVPGISEGSITHGDGDDRAEYPVRAGVVECPMEIGLSHGWRALTEEQALAALAAAPEAKPSGPAVSPEVVGYLNSINAEEAIKTVGAASTLEQLATLEAAEGAGKKRSTVLKAIEAKREDLGKAQQ
jgi:hypothetical protein